MNIFGLILILVKCLILVTSSDPPPLIMPGHVTIGVLSELRVKGSTLNEGESTCQGPIRGWSLQEVAALEWSLATINNQSSKDFEAGLKVFDSCGDKDRMIRQASELLRENEISNSPLIGVIVLGSSPVVSSTISFFHAYSVPLLTTHASDGASLLEVDNVFTTAPHLHAQIQAVLSVILRQRKHSARIELDHRLGVISGCDQALKILQSQAVKASISIHSTIKAIDDKNALANSTMEFIKSQVGFQGTIIVLLETSDINSLASRLDRELVNRAQVFWIFAILDGEPAEGELDVRKMREVFPMAVVVEPHSPLLPGLNQHLTNSIAGNSSIVAPLIPLLEEKKAPCSSETNMDASGNLCHDSQGNGSRHMLSGTRATAAVKAASSLVAAFRLVQIERCSSDTSCPQAFSADINKDMVRSLMKLSYHAQGSSDIIRYTADGRFVTSFTISRVSPFGLQQIGKFREDTGVVWTHPLPGMRSSRKEIKGEVSYAIPSSVDSPDKTLRNPKQGRKAPFDYVQLEDMPQEDSILKEILLTHQDNLGRIYVLILLVWASFGILAALYIGGYVAVRYCDGTILSPQALTALLLIGVVSVYGSCFVYILPPTSISCVWSNILPNVSLVLCYSILVAKAMHLKAYVSVGVGGVVPLSNVYITLAFMLGIQLALSFLTHKDLTLSDRAISPLVELDSNGIRRCRRESVVTFCTQHYLSVLIGVSFILGFVNRKLSRDHHEGRWLFVVSISSFPIVIGWMALSFWAPREFDVPAACAACLILPSLILGLIFIPKIRIIARQSHEFNHKKLMATPSLSTIFSHMDSPQQTLHPPPPFCDSPCPSISCSKSHQRIDPATMRPWREFQDSPAYQRPPVPPPPPPPLGLRNPLYSGTVCYP